MRYVSCDPYEVEAALAELIALREDRLWPIRRALSAALADMLGY